MHPALSAAKSGLDAQQTRMAIVSNNLANVNTVGFKKGRPIFEDLLYQNVTQVGSATSQDTQSATGLMLGTGVRVVATEKNYSQGNVNQTGNPLDIAINGRGFFQVLMPDGTTAYTRAGDFQLSDKGQIVTSSGYILQPGITIPNGAQSISIGHDGIITVVLPGQTAPTQIGTVQIADFINPAGLQPRGENLLLETLSSGTAQPGTPGLSGLGTLAQGETESSNVNVVEEMVAMIETQRAYEMNTKAIQTVDQMLQYLSSNI